MAGPYPVEINERFFSVLIVAVLISAQYVLTSLVVSSARKKAFTPEFMANF